MGRSLLKQAGVLKWHKVVPRLEVGVYGDEAR